jgi:hypothetical protein
MGRPPKNHPPGIEIVVSIQMTSELKMQLQAASNAGY